MIPDIFPLLKVLEFQILQRSPTSKTE